MNQWKLLEINHESKHENNVWNFFQNSNKDNREMREICTRLAMKTLEQ